MRFDTKIVVNPGSKDPYTGALSVPIYPASTYAYKDLDGMQEYNYSRTGNPTRKALEETLATLDGGARGFAFASGVAATTTALVSVLASGDHVVATEQIYGGAYRIITTYLHRFGIEHTFVDTSNPDLVKAAIKRNTKALFLESPSNPLQKIIDFKAMAKIAKENDIITIVDNTFLTPYFFRPLSFGMDMVVHSATKYLGGHSDLVAGAVVARSDDLGEAVYATQIMVGNMLSPENSWLLLRGMKTLRARMTMQAEGALKVAQWLTKQPWVEAVYYPGLPQHPGHEIIKNQASGFGAVVSFKTDSAERVLEILSGVNIWSVAVSLGGVESIMSYPSRMSHAAIPVETRNALGVTEKVLRLSIGLEDVDDLIEDLEQAALPPHK